MNRVLATIHVDGVDYRVDPTANRLQACLSAGLDIPYFCWHPALGSVGACRQCAVKQYAKAEDRSGRIVMSCMTAAADGTRISIADPEAVEFRKSVIEWLMTNHPHDCPVCEEGGECHLQDMTLMSGHTYRRYRFGKRTHRNQYLGPFIKHEMNRCIACYRCVRFYRDYAGGRDLDVHAAHNDVYFGRHEDGVLENEFSGNLVEVCPTGVFTDKTLSAMYARKWDMEGAPSVCVHCGLGCNTIANSRSGVLRRVLNRYNGEVNRYFICDRGRFGYGFVNAESRIRVPLIAGGDAAEPVSGRAALERVRDLLAGRDVLGIGSPRASLEANFALRELVGAARFHAGVSDSEFRLMSRVRAAIEAPPVPIASLREAEECDAVLVLGEDVANTAPRLALTLRQTVRHAAIAIAAKQRVPAWQDAAVRDAACDHVSPLFIAAPFATRLDDVATERVCAAPDDIARLGFAIAHAIDANAAAVRDLSTETTAQVERIATALQRASRPLVVAGVACGSEAVLGAAEAVARALAATGREARIVFTVPECNSLGLALLGGAPIGAALDALRSGQASVVVLENDLYRRADHASVEAALNAARHVVVIDHTLTETVRHAEVVLPAATYAEGDGTLVSNEGRAQRFFQVLMPEDEVAESWRWLDRIAAMRTGGDIRWPTLDEVIGALVRHHPALQLVAAAAPGEHYRVAGNRVRSAPHRFSGRTAMHLDRSVREPIPLRNPDAPFTNSMEGYYGAMPGALYPFFWAPGWNSAQALNKFQEEVGGPLRGGDTGVRLFASGSRCTTSSSAPNSVEPQDDGRNGSAAGAANDGTAPIAPQRTGFDADGVPSPFARRDGEWLVVARHPIFGAEELSAFAPAMDERIAPAVLAVHPEDARTLGASDGGLVEIKHSGRHHRIRIRAEPGMVRGVAALTVGVPGIAWMPLPAWMAIRRVGPSEPGR
jgi:NADH-quinone oxidoreductase subunit G